MGIRDDQELRGGDPGVEVAQLQTHKPRRECVCQASPSSSPNVPSVSSQSPVGARERWRQLRTRTKQLTCGLGTSPTYATQDALSQAAPGASMLHKDFWLEALDAQHRYGFHLRAFHRAWKDAMAAQSQLDDRRNASFFFWLDRGAGSALELPECTRQALQSMRVEYCDASARRAYEVRLVPAHVVAVGEQEEAPPPLLADDCASSPIAFTGGVRAVYATTHCLVHTDELSKWIFVIALDGSMYVGRKRKGVFHHSSFVAGAPILAAGKVMIKHGRVLAIEPHSGHFKPTLKNLAALCSVLRAQGVDLDHIAFIKPKKWACEWPFAALPAHLLGCELEDLASDTDYCSYKSDSEEP